MWNEPTEEELKKMPVLYANEGNDIKDTLICMHFFIGNSDWYASEYSPKERIFYGFVILNDDYLNAEWGYFSLDELRDIKIGWIEIDRDLYWRTRKAIEVEKILKANRHW